MLNDGFDWGSPCKQTEPVRFEVYRNTRLLWNATYDEDSSEHVFAGRLLWVSGSSSVGLSDHNGIGRLGD